MLYIILLPLLALLMISLPLFPVIKKVKTGEKAKNAIILNLVSFFGLMIVATMFPLTGLISAETVEAAGAAVEMASAGYAYIAAGISTGLGSIGCGIAVGQAAPAAIGAVAEEPKSFGKALIFVALGEGVALYGFIIAFLIILPMM